MPYQLLHSSLFWPGEETGAAASRGRGAPSRATPCATHDSLRARVARGRASAGRRARPGGAGGHRYCGKGSPATGKVGSQGRPLVSHAPVLAAPLPARPQPRPRPPPTTSSTRLAPSKPRAPLGLTAEVAARARGRERRGHRHQRPGMSPSRAETKANQRRGGPRASSMV
jgi:hypothetical protein